MTPTPRLLFALGSSALWLLACGSPLPPDSDELTTDPLATYEQVQLWDARENTIPLCWMPTDFAGGEDFLDEKRVIEAAIERTWAAVTPLRFVWSPVCGELDVAVRVQLGEHTQVIPATAPPPPPPPVLLTPEAMADYLAEYQRWFDIYAIYDHSSDGRASAGMGALSLSNAQMTGPGRDDPGISIWIERPQCLLLGCNRGSLEWQSRLEYIAVHEMGHVLGFIHEQDRKDNPGDCARGDPPAAHTWGPYDPDSIMNYCNSRGAASPELSEGDISAVRKLYGWRVLRENALADVTGNGKVDPIAVNADAIYVRGHDFFTESEEERARFGTVSVQATPFPFYGNRATAFADVDRDQRADAIAINDDGIYVMVSVMGPDGNPRFDQWRQWSPPFYGDRRTLVGDVTGDGRADIVAVFDDGNTYVARARDGSFDVPVPLWQGRPWSRGFFGTLSTELADVDGDRKADLIANNGDGGVWVALSLGNRFAPPTEWRSPLFGSRGTTYADVTGDERADLITLHDDGIHVAVSDGSSFAGDIRWTTHPVPPGHPVLGQRATLFGRVDDDRRADAVLVNDDGLWVQQSNGYLFRDEGRWTAPFYTIP